MKEDNEHGQDFVEIVVGEGTYRIHRGRQSVADIKQVAGVPLAYELDQLIDGVLTPLPDDGFVVIKPGLQFAAQPRRGQGS